MTHEPGSMSIDISKRRIWRGRAPYVIAGISVDPNSSAGGRPDRRGRETRRIRRAYRLRTRRLTNRPILLDALMNTDVLERLLAAYKVAPSQYRATSYWQSYEQRVLAAVRDADPAMLRSGRYPILATFGMGDTIYSYHPNMPMLERFAARAIRRYIIANRKILPYGLRTADVQDIAYRHCELLGRMNDAIAIDTFGVSTYGGPRGVFRKGQYQYTVPFLNYYIRYASSRKHIAYTGKEILVELGSGSGYQTEVLKKCYPGMTILCFDLPMQIFLCRTYLAEALGQDQIVGPEETLDWEDLSHLVDGKVHLFGSWKFPLLDSFRFDVFWNAASFGEMEPDSVANYLGVINRNAKWVYLLQAQAGKELTGRAHVKKRTAFDDYARLLCDYDLVENHDAWAACRKMTGSGGYFEAIWRLADASRDNPPADNDSHSA